MERRKAKTMEARETTLIRVLGLEWRSSAATGDGQALAITFSSARKILSKTFWTPTYSSMRLQIRLQRWLLNLFSFFKPI
jgi:hypothetical protein